MSGVPAVEVDGLAVRFQQRDRTIHAVNGVSFRLARGEVLGILGESGSGKSVTLRSLMRLLPHNCAIDGRITLDGEDVTAASERRIEELRGSRIAMIFQEPVTALDPVFTIGTQITETLVRHLRIARPEARKRALEWLERVQIPSARRRFDSYPHEMSGGMRQRIVGAIGISCEPRLLIADEPTTSLDLTIQAQYLNLLRELQRAHGLALIFITHNLGIVAKMCDRLAVMYAGRVVESGPVSRIFNAPSHPYTEALLNSVPRMTDSDQRLAAIEGQPPDLSSLPPGCSFAPRCSRVFDRCCIEAPPEVALGERQTVRCWLAEPQVDSAASAVAGAVG